MNSQEQPLPIQPKAESSDAEGDGSISDGDPPGYCPPEIQDDGSGLRRWEELENIVFATPIAFRSLASQIAQSRHVPIVISDDRTHKVTSAYMHITCAFRSSGCPFILKLTKFKSGGWILKKARAIETDNKQRSVYHCNHPEGSVANFDPKAGKSLQAHAGRGRRPGSLRKRTREDEEKMEEKISRPPKVRHSMGLAATGSPRKLDLDSEEDSRVLAPPFQRSLALQSKIQPVLSVQNSNSLQTLPASYPRLTHSLPRSNTVNRIHSAPNTIPKISFPNPSRAPQTQAPQLQPQPQTQAVQQSWTLPMVSQHIPIFSKPPLMPVPPSTEGEWREYLMQLDPAFASHSAVLGNPAVGVSPAAFFSESEELRDALLDILEIPLWPKVKLKMKLKKDGMRVWERFNANGTGKDDDTKTVSEGISPSVNSHEFVDKGWNNTDPSSNSTASASNPSPLIDNDNDSDGESNGDPPGMEGASVHGSGYGYGFGYGNGHYNGMGFAPPKVVNMSVT